MSKQIIIYFGLLVILLSGCAADLPKDRQTLKQEQDLAQLKSYFFVNLVADTIVDPTRSLNRFFADLRTVKTVPRDSIFLQVPIIHYGDSHIQAGYITEVVRRRMQNLFGNAGRGLITPLKLASTNEPRDYSITSPDNFSNSKIIERGSLNPIPGVSGLAVYNPGSNQHFTISAHQVPEDSLDYAFSRIKVFHDSLSPMITADPKLMSDDYGSDIFYSYATDLELLTPTDSISLYTYAENQFKNGSFYGFSLENDNNGVLYHAIGINGACYLHWGMRESVVDQSRALNPKLIMISLGANEAAGRNFIESVFYNEVNSFVTKLRTTNPEAAILLIAPAEAMRRTRNSHTPNANYAKVSDVLRRYAAAHDLAFFDLFQTLAGKGSSINFNAVNLMQRDKLHFTPEGYAIQGLLIYNALLNGYNKYVR